MSDEIYICFSKNGAHILSSETLSAALPENLKQQAQQLGDVLHRYYDKFDWPGYDRQMAGALQDFSKILTEHFVSPELTEQCIRSASLMIRTLSDVTAEKPGIIKEQFPEHSSKNSEIVLSAQPTREPLSRSDKIALASLVIAILFGLLGLYSDYQSGQVAENQAAEIEQLQNTNEMLGEVVSLLDEILDEVNSRDERGESLADQSAALSQKANEVEVLSNECIEPPESEINQSQVEGQDEIPDSQE